MKPVFSIQQSTRRALRGLAMARTAGLLLAERRARRSRPTTDSESERRARRSRPTTDSESERRARRPARDFQSGSRPTTAMFTRGGLGTARPTNSTTGRMVAVLAGLLMWFGFMSSTPAAD